MSAATEPKAVRELPLERITCAPQVREHFDDEELAGLAQSLREVGLQQPILVRPAGEGWVVIDGERRTRAARMAGWTTIPAIIDEGQLSDADVIRRQLVANVQRADLRPVEKARAIDRLMKEAGWSAAQVAAKLGLSPASISKLLALLVLPVEVQQSIDAGLAASTGYEIARTRDAGVRAELIAEAKRGTLTRDKASERARAGAKNPVARPTRAPARRERAVFTLGGKRSVCFTGPELTVAAIAAWIEELLAHLRSVGDSATSVADAVEAIAARLKADGGGR